MTKLTLNRENTVQILNNSVDRGRLMGAFTLKDAAAIKMARDYFNPEVKEKPTFNDAPDPHIAAINIFIQAVQKAQAHGGEYAFTFEDAALLWEIIEFWVKESGNKAVVTNETANPESKAKERDARNASAQPSVSQLRSNARHDSSDDEEERDVKSSRSAAKKRVIPSIREIDE